MGLFSSVGLALCRQFLRLLKERHQPESPGFFRITVWHCESLGSQARAG